VEALSYNTAIAAMMEYLNVVRAGGRRAERAAVDPLLLLVAPFAPHLAEELWQRTGHAGSITQARWPEADPRWLEEDAFELAVQVNGKLRATTRVPRATPPEGLEEAARAAAAAQLAGKSVVKVVVVPGRLVNFVVR